LIEKIKHFVDFGKDFEMLAVEYSEESVTGERLVKKGEMIGVIDEAVFSLKNGEVSDIIKSPIGFHLFKVIEIIPGQLIDFDLAKDDIENLLYRQKIDSNLNAWLNRLRNNAYICIK